MAKQEQEFAIIVDKVYKDFKLPHQRKNSLKSIFTGLLESNQSQETETQHALKDISFNVKKGEFFGIVGRNGSGKSTLLKILAGIYQPNKGVVHVGGKLVPFIELGVGFNPELTGRENVYLNGAMLGFKREKIDEMYDDIVNFAEIERFMDQKLKNYSSGMQVRLAFSMAIRADADVLLVDEVLAVGDADFQRKCFDYFRKLKRNKKTVVFVTHDMSAVAEYCDRAMLINENKVVAISDASDIARQYNDMFIKKAADEVELDEGDKRTGNQTVTYDSIVVENAKLNDGDDVLVINAQATARKTVDNPIFGIMIRNGSGAPVLGTNTKIKQVRLKKIEKDETVSVRWEIPNIFNEGLHYVDPAIVSNDGTVICDWWDEAATFRVRRLEKTPYIVSPKIEVQLEKRLSK